MSIKALAERILRGNPQENRTETKSFLIQKQGKPESFQVSLPIGGNQETTSTDNVLPLRRAWIENNELRTVGVFNNLADEIVKLTGDDMTLQRRLLVEHCQQYGPAHFWALIEQWEERAAIMEYDGGLTDESRQNFTEDLERF